MATHYDKDYNTSGYSEKSWDGSTIHYDKNYNVIGHTEAPDSYGYDPYGSSTGSYVPKSYSYSYSPSPREKKYGPKIYKITSLFYKASIAVCILLGIYAVATFFAKGQIPLYTRGVPVIITITAFVALYSKALYEDEIPFTPFLAFYVGTAVIGFLIGQTSYNLKGYNTRSAYDAMMPFINSSIGYLCGSVPGALLGLLTSKCIFMENRKKLRSLLSMTAMVLFALLAAVRALYPNIVPGLQQLTMPVFLLFEIGLILWRFYASYRAGKRKLLFALAEDAIWAFYFTCVNLRIEGLVAGLQQYPSMVLQGRHCQLLMGLLTIVGITGMIAGSTVRKKKK